MPGLDNKRTGLCLQELFAHLSIGRC